MSLRNVMNENGSLFRSNQGDTYKVINAEVADLKNFNSGAPITLTGPGLDGKGTATLGQMNRIEVNELYGTDGILCATLAGGQLSGMVPPSFPGVVGFQNLTIAAPTPEFTVSLSDYIPCRVTFQGVGDGFTGATRIGLRAYNDAANQISVQNLKTVVDGATLTQAITRTTPLLGNSVFLTNSTPSTWHGGNVMVVMDIIPGGVNRSIIQYVCTWRDNTGNLCESKGSLDIVSGLRTFRFRTENGAGLHGQWDSSLTSAKIEYLIPY